MAFRVAVLRSFPLIVLIILAAAPAAGQGTTATTEFRVVTADGQVIVDLKPADVSVKVNGKAREVRALDFVRVGGPPAGKAAGPRPSPPFASNAPGDGGRDILLVVDDDSIAAGRDRPLHDTIEQLLAGLSSPDRVGLLATRLQGVNVQLTTDRAQVRSALAEMNGAAPGTESAGDLTCRSGIVLGTIAKVFEAPFDRPLSIVFISSSMASPLNSGATITMGQMSGLCRLVPDNFNAVAAAAVRSRATPYIVYYLEGAEGADAGSRAQGLEALAGVLETDLMRLAGNTASAVVSRILNEASAYYVARFDMDPSERTGNAAKLEVRVARENVKVRAPSGIVLPKGAPTPREMLRAATTYGDFPIRAAGYASRNHGDDKVKVLVLLEPAVRSTNVKAASIGLFDQKGTLKAQATLQESEMARTPTIAALVVPPGRYRLRVAATDADGRAGTVDYPMAAELIPGGTARFSSLVIGVSDSGSFAPRLQLGADPAALAYLEVYGVPKAAALEVTLELAASMDGPAMATATTTVVQGSVEDMRIAYGGFDIAALQPGDYVVRGLVTIDGKPAGRAVRTLRKAAR